MEEIVFETKEDLLKRLMPALRTRVNSLKKTGYSYIKEHDIWDALSEKWNDESGLELCDMVDDILHVEDTFLSNFYYTKTNKNKLVEMDTIIDLPKLK